MSDLMSTVFPAGDLGTYVAGAPSVNALMGDMSSGYVGLPGASDATSAVLGSLGGSGSGGTSTGSTGNSGLNMLNALANGPGTLPNVTGNGPINGPTGAASNTTLGQIEQYVSKNTANIVATVVGIVFVGVGVYGMVNQ